jgi:hypothetical protein
VPCLLRPPGGGGGGGRFCVGTGGATAPGIGGGGRLERLLAILVGGASNLGERGGDLGPASGDWGIGGGGGFMLSAAVVSEGLSKAAPDISSSDSEPSLGDPAAGAAGRATDSLA